MSLFSFICYDFALFDRNYTSYSLELPTTQATQTKDLARSQPHTGELYGDPENVRRACRVCERDGVDVWANDQD